VVLFVGVEYVRFVNQKKPIRIHQKEGYKKELIKDIDKIILRRDKMSMLPREKLNELSFREKIIVFGGTGACVLMIFGMLFMLIHLLEG